MPDEDACRRQIAKILASQEFDATDRERRFLSYVVEESLAGRADRIKAYSIAMAAFGRDASFDPQTDPIVRVEAGHLRRALDRYYLGAGKADAVEITIPKGGYVPKFEWLDTSKQTERPTLAPPIAPPSRLRIASRWALPGIGLVAAIAVAVLVALWDRNPSPIHPDIPRLLVQPFDDLSQSDASAAIARGLTQEVVGQISKFRDLIVIVADPKDDRSSASDTQRGSLPRYALTGSVEIDANDIRLQARLVSKADGAVVWANSYTGDRSVSRLIEIERDIAEQVATTLAQPYGVIFQADAARDVASPPEDWSAYACTLAYYAYRTTLDRDSHPRIRRCLEDAVARFPAYATAWGLLSQVYIDEVRFRFAPDPSEGPASVERALAAARKAVALDPMNIRGLEAEMFALYFAGDMSAAIQIGRQAMAINPNDTELMGEFGYRLALSGDWDEGCPLVEVARKRNPGPLGYYESALALCAYQRGDLDEAAMWVRKTPLLNNPIYHLIAAMIYGEIGDPNGPGEVEWLRQNAPKLYANARKEVAYRIGRKEDVDRFMASAQKAGLPIDGQSP
ncbi:MAG: hypothetical protein DI533_03345 [Cereibacter sphaeroides]|uniref:Uncharacterized protein n=1 Tax=Cereibacter sphaeroides TaxID=1063 RepID=A0A2W5SFB4_CERSP|nr:MAG: hypothetical protein DI533_03345 [Cereibacter sphaeroides]